MSIIHASLAIIGISHYHQDHTGQAHHFPQARLLMGKADIAALRSGAETYAKEYSKSLAHWLGGGGKLEEVDGDRDVFKVNSVVMLNLPGHTPGHHGNRRRSGNRRRQSRSSASAAVAGLRETAGRSQSPVRACQSTAPDAESQTTGPSHAGDRAAPRSTPNSRTPRD